MKIQMYPKVDNYSKIFINRFELFCDEKIIKDPLLFSSNSFLFIMNTLRGEANFV